MASKGRWRTLDVAIPGAPQLLLKTDITPTGYHVQLTDMSRVWVEKLSKRDIIRRAWDDHCSIDPSEDDKQFNIFLEKIEGALNHEDGTTFDLMPAENSDLCLRVSAELPKPFDKLVWTLSLAHQSDGALASSLTLPLLQEASSLQLQVRQLIHELQEKDRIIEKLSDRLETSGNDLTTVFPGVSNIRTNKKRTQREQLSKHVKGLASFDEDDWRSRSLAEHGGDWWQRVGGVLRELPDGGGAGGKQSTESEWWKGLSGTPRAKQANGATLKAMQESSGTLNDTDQEQDDSLQDDEFQRQRTPEHLKWRPSGADELAETGHTTAQGAKAQEDTEPLQRDDGDSTTEDEDDLDAIPKSKSHPRKRTSSSPAAVANPNTEAPRKLGAIGGGASRPPPSPATATEERARSEADDGAAETSRPRGKLGAIGGKAKTSSTTPEPPAISSSTAPRKMGIHGGKRKPFEPITESVESPEPAAERSRAPTKESTPPARETSQERADRKRDQLKKELEQKAKAPVRKKRKF